MTRPAPLASRVRRGSDPEILSRICEPGTGLAIWERRPEPDFTAWIEDLPPETLPRLRTVVAAGAVEAAVTAACENSGIAPHPMREQLASDAGALAALMAGALSCDFLTIRLDVIDTDACRRFHIDRVRARLLCTYRGRGTEFGEAGRAGASPARVESLAPGTAGLFRGALWPAPELPGILHRSPPLGDSGETRLLLVIDPFLPDEDGDMPH